MSVKIFSFIIISAAIIAMPFSANAQNAKNRIVIPDTASIKATDALTHKDSLTLASDDTKIVKKQKRDWATWRPEPKKPYG